MTQQGQQNRHNDGRNEGQGDVTGKGQNAEGAGESQVHIAIVLHKGCSIAKDTQMDSATQNNNQVEVATHPNRQEDLRSLQAGIHITLATLKRM